MGSSDKKNLQSHNKLTKNNRSKNELPNSVVFLRKNKGMTKNYYEKISNIFQRVYVGV